MRYWLSDFLWRHKYVIEAVSYVCLAVIVGLVLLAFVLA